MLIWQSCLQIIYFPYNLNMNQELYDPQGKGKKQGSNKAKMDKKTIARIIKDLVRRRQEHEIRINKLLGPNYLPQDITKISQRQNCNEFSEMLRRLQVQQPHGLHQSMGSLGNHVNLLATVSLKTQYFLSEKQHIKEEGQLYNSLLKRYGKKTIKYDFKQQKPKGVQLWLENLVQYLMNEELADGLFALSQGLKGKWDFYGTYFMRGKYEQILLSKQEIEQGELNFAYVPLQQPQVINISWLLLWRLLKQASNLNMPLAINRLFSFPYKKYHIQQSLELINMNQLINILEKDSQANERQQQTLKVYGFQKTGKINQIANIKKSINLANYIPLIHHYQQILVMNQIQFPVKSIPLSCLKHHFVVVTLIVKHQDYYYLNIGGKESGQIFKVCLLDFEGNLMQYQTINNGQFMLSSLKQEEYELYICPISIGQLNELDQSYELVKQKQQQFSLWVQGKSVCSKEGDLQLQIRLKQQYNSYTMQIAKKYISSHNNSSEQIIAQPGIITVKRHILRVMDLVVDTFISSTKSKLTVKYQSNNLCDQYFQDSSVFIKPNDSIVLCEQSPIESITSDSLQKLSFKIIYFFL